MSTETAKFTPEQQRDIAAVAELQRALSVKLGAPVSDARFCQMLGSGAPSETTWLRLKNGTYAGDVLGQLEAVLPLASRLRGKYQLDRVWRPAAWLDLPHVTALARAVAEAKRNAAERHIKRLVWLRMPQGWGKTQALRHQVELDDNPHSIFVTAAPRWRGNYFWALRDLGRLLRIADGDLRGIGAAETAVMDRLKRLSEGEKPVLLALDEVEYFSADLLRLLKAIMNETNAVVAVGCLPEFYREIRRLGGLHAKQLLRRNVDVIDQEPISARGAAQFLPECAKWRMAQAAILAERANGGGGINGPWGNGYDLIAWAGRRLGTAASEADARRMAEEAADRYAAITGDIE